MFEAFLGGLIGLFHPVVFGVILLAAVISLIMGVIPGLQGGLGMILLLPLIYNMDPDIALPFLISLYSVSLIGGSVTAILLGIPGDPGNAATVIDGFAMAKKGEGGRAVGAAITSSVVGGVVAVGFAFMMIPAVVPLVKQFRSPQMFLLILFGLCFLSVLTRNSPIKGVISAGIGLLLATVGFQAKTGVARFNFGNLYLYDGIDLLALLLGVFALPVLVGLNVTGKTIAREGAPPPTYRQMFRGMRDVFLNLWLFIRCTIIGYIVGVIPGLGGSTAIWVCYGHAKQSSKEPDKFGTGVVEGVIAPESANNAKDSGGMLTTLVFGLPGSAVMVILLAAMLILGLQPGPRFMYENPALFFKMILCLAVANIIGGILAFTGVRWAAKITIVPPHYIFCILMPVIFIGVFISRGLMIDVLVLLCIGLIGILMEKFGYSVPSLLIGFVLGSQLEYYLWQSVSWHGPVFFFTSPLSFILIAGIVMTLCWPLLQHFRKNRETL